MKKEKLSPEQIQGLLAQYCPHYYSNEHVDEILKGTPEQLTELFKKTKLSCVEEVALMEKAPAEVIEAYIQTNHLYADAQVALVKRGDQKLIDFFRQKSFNGLGSAAKVELVRSFRPRSQKWWKDYLRYPSKLEGEAELALIETHDIGFLKLYLDDHNLSDDACILMLETYIYDEISRLIRECPRFYLTKEAEAHFVKEMCDLLIEEYLANHSLYEQGQVALVEKGDHSLIMQYLEKHNFTSKEAIIMLVKRGDYDEVSTVMKNRTELPWQAEVSIVKGASDKLFNLLNAKGRLSEQAEYALAIRGIKPQGHDRIMRYLGKRAISDASAVNIIMMRGNSDEIKACIKRKCLDGNAPRLLIERGMRDEIELYISVNHLKWKIPE